MIKDYTILSNIISEDEQNILEKYVKESNLNWYVMENITGEFGGKMHTMKFPAKVLSYENIDKEILKIINKIELSVCEKINQKYVRTYRCKINYTKPIDFDYDSLDLIHIDMKAEHIVIVYYINDSDGDTVILKNKDGIGMDNMFKHINGVAKENFVPIKKVKPIKGSVVVFNGNLYHYGEFPKINDRYVINLDVAIKNDNHEKIL